MSTAAVLRPQVWHPGGAPAPRPTPTPERPQYIQTETGIGYRLRAPE